MEIIRKGSRTEQQLQQKRTSSERKKKLNVPSQNHRTPEISYILLNSAGVPQQHFPFPKVYTKDSSKNGHVDALPIAKFSYLTLMRNLN
jgi:hypothetical protein